MRRTRHPFRFPDRSGRRPRRAARGFTLVEVLLAAVIIALGVLGLGAVFAGAISQQQRSSQVTLSVGVTRNAEAMLSREFGRLTGQDLVNGDIQEGVWYALPMRNDVDPALTVDPLQLGNLYFADSAPGIALFTNTVDPATGLPAIGGAAALGRGNYTAGSGFAPPPFGGQEGIKALPHERISPSPALQVTIQTAIAPGVPPGPGFPREITFSIDQSGAQMDLESDTPDADFPPTVRFESTGFAASGSTLEMYLAPLNSVPPGGVGAGAPAFISSFNISPPLEVNEFITSITISDYEWRNDRLVSLNDRLTSVEDASFPRGRRPILGFTGLFRSLGNTSQLAVLTYSLRPQSRPDLGRDDFPFLPRETSDDIASGQNSSDSTGSMLRLMTDLTFGFDEDREQYYLQLETDDLDTRGWLLDPGQVLMMRGAETTPPEPGSDVAVRVVSIQDVRDDDGETTGAVRGYLDRSPRVGGESPLRNINQTTTIDMFALFDTIESRSDGTLWTVKPVEFRIFQITGQ